MRMKYVIEVRNNDGVHYPKSSHDIGELREWIHNKYPTAVKLPVIPSEVLAEWYVDKYISHFTKRKFCPELSTILIKKTF